MKAAAVFSNQPQNDNPDRDHHRRRKEQTFQRERDETQKQSTPQKKKQKQKKERISKRARRRRDHIVLQPDHLTKQRAGEKRAAWIGQQFHEHAEAEIGARRR